jgi:AhpD family alkylhydroperoxidase
MKPNTFFNRMNRKNLPEHMQAAWDDSMAVHDDATFVEVLGNSPKIYDWYMNDFYKKVFYSGRISLKIVELVRLRLANIHGCAFCNRGDTIDALRAGISKEQIANLDNYQNGPFSDKEKAVLTLADVMVLTNPNGSVSKKIYKECKEYFTDSEMVELGVIMAVLCGMAKFIFAYDLVEKEEYCPFIPKEI